MSLSNIRHLALDLDGTIYMGGTLFDTTLPFLERLRQLRIGCSFLTNNPTRSARQYLAHLRRMGIPAKPEQLCTSTQAAIDYLLTRRPELRRWFVLGTAGLHRDLATAGFRIVHDDAQAEPDAVLVGFDTSLTYLRLCRAAWWIKQGKPWFATNPDRVCPTDQPTVLVDCGSICAALESATGRKPEKVFGKPDPAMLDRILRRHRLQARNLAMVGDRLYTDMAMARNAGAVSVLVLTGETTAAEARRARPRPDLVVATLAELGDRLRKAARAASH